MLLMFEMFSFKTSQLRFPCRGGFCEVENSASLLNCLLASINKYRKLKVQGGGGGAHVAILNLPQNAYLNFFVLFISASFCSHSLFFPKFQVSSRSRCALQMTRLWVFCLVFLALTNTTETKKKRRKEETPQNETYALEPKSPGSHNLDVFIGRPINISLDLTVPVSFTGF